MRTRIRYIIGWVTALVLLGSCSKKLEKLYYDPDELATAKIEKLFTEMLNNDRVRPSYWEMRTFAVMHSAIYSQTVGFLNATGVYQQNLNYTEMKWNDFYRPAGNGSGTLALYREMQKLYDGLNGYDRIEASIFLQAATVVLYDQACQMVDLWGDIPFSEAGSLNLTGEAVMAKFDKGEDVYRGAIETLNELNDFFATVQPDASTQNLFRTQDILLRGDVSKWRRYCNSLRLRLLMRISNVFEDYARTRVTEMLADPDRFPLLSDQPGYNPDAEDILLHPMANYNLYLWEAMTEMTNFSAPWHMLENILLPLNDPRISVLYDKYGTYIGSEFSPNTEYRAMPVDWPLEQQQVSLGKFAVLDSSTFLYNSFIPGIVMSSAEVSFLKAEAFLRWGGGDPSEMFKLGIRQSIDFYYYLNRLNARYKNPEPFPSEADLSGFLSQSDLQLNGSREQKLEKIATQRWVHFNFLQSAQAWSELRRTGYPRLSFRENSQPDASVPPRRLVYPGNEVTYNVNYEAVREKDKPYFAVFWQTD